MNNSKFIRFAGLVGIIGSIFGFSAIFASTLLCGPGCGNPIPPPFDETNSWTDDGSFCWKSNALSDLGVSEVDNIYNSSLIILGILDLIFIIGFVRAHARSALFYLGGILLILASVSTSLVGVFTEAYATPHMILAMVVFVLEPIGLMWHSSLWEARSNMDPTTSWERIISLRRLLVAQSERRQVFWSFLSYQSGSLTITNSFQVLYGCHCDLPLHEEPSTGSKDAGSQRHKEHLKIHSANSV